MTATTKTLQQQIADLLARKRMWERIGDPIEAEICSDQLDNLIDQLPTRKEP